MAKQNEKMSFEEALAGLEAAAEVLKNDDTTLETAIKSYEKGIAYYQYCFDILNEAKQKIEVYDRK